VSSDTILTIADDIGQATLWELLFILEPEDCMEVVLIVKKSLQTLSPNG
jgi:hypothetical protein